MQIHQRQLIWRNRKSIFSNIYSTKFFTFLTPDEWKRGILPIFNRFGGVQTGYESTQETWRKYQDFKKRDQYSYCHQPTPH